MKRSAALLLFLVGVSPALAGTYFGVVFYVRRGDPLPPEGFKPFVIVHPPGYTGQAGTVVVKICVRPEDQPLIVPPLQWAIATWNSLQPIYRNDPVGLTAEDFSDNGATELGTTYDLASVLLHELGHCALGLDHVNLEELDDLGPLIYRTGKCDADNDGICGELTSYTESVNATGVNSTNTIRGDHDDNPVNFCPSIPSMLAGIELPPVCSARSVARELDFGVDPCPVPAECCPTCPGPNCPPVPMQVQDVAWFRRNSIDPIANNNPIHIDAGVIDMTTMSRSATPANLPPGHTYVRNANKLVANALGHSKTASIMYVPFFLGKTIVGLSADDVNMVKLANTGHDRTIGGGDDYSVTLEYEPLCPLAQIEIRRVPGPLELIAVCEALLASTFAETPAIHYTMTPPVGEDRLIIEVDGMRDFGAPLVFASSLETGDTSEWSVSQP